MSDNGKTMLGGEERKFIFYATLDGQGQIQVHIGNNIPFPLLSHADRLLDMMINGMIVNQTKQEQKIAIPKWPR